MDPDSAEVKAAGCVVYRRAAPDEDDVTIALVHRPRYDDWSLPKGKLDAGESWEQAALREVREETGLEGELGAELTPVAYDDRKGRHKVVRYWVMEAASAGAFEPNDEVDALVWAEPGEALSRLTYEQDRATVARALDVIA
jgi:8-oxo-dGTP diphosphatase